MRKVVVIVETEERMERIWKSIMELDKLFKLVKFVKKVSIQEPVQEGMIFYDVTGILWIPIPIKHKITTIKEHEKFAIEAYLPLKSGKMFQTISVKDMGGHRKIEMEIKFNIDFPIFDIIFGYILELRLMQMIKETFKNIESYLNNKEGVTKIRFSKIVEK